jgi:hypothetical protein
LSEKTHAWPYQLAKQIGCDQVVNLGKEASSVYHLPLQIAEYEKLNITNPVFAVGITDEARIMMWNTRAGDWYKLTGVPELAKNPELTNYMKEFATEVDTFAFREFNLGLILSWLQNYFVANGHEYLMFTQFNSFESRFFDHMIDKSKIHRGGVSILADLADYIPADNFSPYGDAWSFYDVINNNQYFQGKIAHPNDLGHEKIATLLSELYNNCYEDIQKLH